jgi:hypothetical protein
MLGSGKAERRGRSSKHHHHQAARRMKNENKAIQTTTTITARSLPTPKALIKITIFLLS